MTEVDLVELSERVARLEVAQKMQEHHNSSIASKLDTLITRFNKYEAKWGGVFMVMSALGAITLAFKNELLKWFMR